jgi:hypothetical protein
VKKTYQKNAAQHRLRRVDDLHRPTHSSKVKNWQNGTMALRWCAAGRIKAGKQFRRVTASCTCPRSAPPSMRKAPRRLSAPS